LEIQRVAARGVGYSDPRRTPVCLSVRDREMQRRLFGPHVNLVAPVSDARMGSVLRDLRAAPELHAFQLWLVGSRVQPGRDASDIDLVLSPRSGTVPSEHGVERALWCCREYGLYRGSPACVIDPCFRLVGPTLAQVPLRPDAVIKTVKLLSPKLVHLVLRGRIRHFRRVGHLAIEFVRRAAETEYYGKLPRADFDGSRSPYLRPAIEVIATADDDVSDGRVTRRFSARDCPPTEGRPEPARVDPNRYGSTSCRPL